MKMFFAILFPFTLFAGLYMSGGIDYDSKSFGMRGSDFALIRSNNGFLSNPAKMSADHNDNYFYSTYKRYFSDVYLVGTQYVHPGLILKKYSTGFSIAAVNYGDFVDMESNYTYRPYEIALSVSQGYLLGEVMTGLNIHYIYSSISPEYNSSAFSADIAFLYSFMEGKAVFGAGIFNAGFQIDPYYGTRESIDPIIRSAASYRIKNIPLTLTLQKDYNLDHLNSLRVMAGFELEAKENLIVRLGYDHRGSDWQIGDNNTREKFGGLSLGATVIISEIEYDFAYLINGGIENEFSMSAGFKLNKFIK